MTEFNLYQVSNSYYEDGGWWIIKTPEPCGDRDPVVDDSPVLIYGQTTYAVLVKSVSLTDAFYQGKEKIEPLFPKDHNLIEDHKTFRFYKVMCVGSMGSRHSWYIQKYKGTYDSDVRSEYPFKHKGDNYAVYVKVYSYYEAFCRGLELINIKINSEPDDKLYNMIIENLTVAYNKSLELQNSLVHPKKGLWPGKSTDGMIDELVNYLGTNMNWYKKARDRFIWEQENSL